MHHLAAYLVLVPKQAVGFLYAPLLQEKAYPG